ncbi:hypothetical protein DFH06DRAFT_1324021 [Mycena polygramma]|nr:hypothetical protein DFH06DRAFT_1324021 [Mycena polygramma]
MRASQSLGAAWKPLPIHQSAYPAGGRCESACQHRTSVKESKWQLSSKSFDECSGTTGRKFRGRNVDLWCCGYEVGEQVNAEDTRRTRQRDRELSGASGSVWKMLIRSRITIRSRPVSPHNDLRRGRLLLSSLIEDRRQWSSKTRVRVFTSRARPRRTQYKLFAGSRFIRVVSGHTMPELLRLVPVLAERQCPIAGGLPGRYTQRMWQGHVKTRNGAVWSMYGTNLRTSGEFHDPWNQMDFPLHRRRKPSTILTAKWQGPAVLTTLKARRIRTQHHDLVPAIAFQILAGPSADTLGSACRLFPSSY